MTAIEKHRDAVLRFRSALKAFESEVQAVIRQLDEAVNEERDETPTVRPPSQPAMRAARVEVIRFPEKGR